MKRLLSFILSITMLLTMSTAVFADGADVSVKPSKIKVGINAQFPPFEYYNENGELYGFDVDLMNYIGERIGFEIEYVDMSFAELIPAVVSGEVACSISAISITEERNNVIDYTIPYLSAKVTHIDGETPDTGIEQYAVVFPNNSVEKGKLAEAAGEPEKSLYNLVNNAISDLIEDKTIEKLGEEHELNKAADTEEFDYEYTVIPVPDSFDKSNMDKSELSSAGQILIASVPYSDWARMDIHKAIKLNIINVDRNYNFPAPITREEFCVLVYNYYGLYADEVEVVNAGNPFLDTENQNVMVLNALGIINGKSKTEFAPDDLLTREEAAVILSRLINVAHPNLIAPELYYEFEDSGEVSDWAMDSIQRICNMGIMNGVGENRFAPQKNYTAEQAIATLVRVYSVKSLQEDFKEEVFRVVDKDGKTVLNDIDLISCKAVKGNISASEEEDWYLEIEISDDGRKRFKEATERVAEYPSGENYLAIMVDGQMISCPAVVKAIDSNIILITGDFAETTAKDLANTIKSE